VNVRKITNLLSRTTLWNRSWTLRASSVQFCPERIPRGRRLSTDKLEVIDASADKRVVMRVLVVEDEAAVAELLRRWLTEWNYEVNTAASTTEALKTMLAEPAEIILCDIRMPGHHDGLWLAERVRAKWPRTAIIIASGVVDTDFVEKSQRIGAIDYVTKPFGREVLRKALDRAAAALGETAN
jgi:two-component system, NtrC family, response regulator AtoC